MALRHYHPSTLLACKNPLVVFLELISLSFSQHVSKLLQRTPDQLCLLPQIGRQEPVGVADSDEGGFQCVFESFGRAGGGSVRVLDTGELQQTFDGRGCDEAGTSRGGDELEKSATSVIQITKHRIKGFRTYSDSDAAAFPAFLRGQTVRRSQVGTPVPAAHGDDAELGDDDGGADGGCDFFGGLDAEADVALGVADDDDGFEAGTLTCAGLFLYGFDLCGRGISGDR